MQHARVVVAGLGAGVAERLADLLPAGTSLQSVANLKGLTEELSSQACSLLVLNHRLGKEPTRAALRKNGLEELGVPVLWCLASDEDPAAWLDIPESCRLYHPLEPEVLAQRIASAVTPPLHRRVQSLAAEVWKRSQPLVNARLEVLAGFAQSLLEGRPVDFPAARRAAQQLADALASFGFRIGSRLAREMASILSSEDLGPQHALRLTERVAALRRELQRAPEVKRRETAGPTVLLLETDKQQARRFTRMAGSHGLSVQRAGAPAEVRERLAQALPDIVILDLGLPGATDLLAEITRAHPQVPVLASSARSHLTDRVEVARMGAWAFLPRPLMPAQVLEVVRDLLERARARDTVARVLVADPSPAVREQVRELLEDQGLRVDMLEDAREFWPTLDRFRPDLTLVDVDMPYYGGCDLCRVVRHDPRWSGMQFLLLTARADAGTIQSMFECGGNDFVVKPIVGPELVARVRNGLDRVQLQRSRAEIDPLTGLPNRHQSTAALNRSLRLAERHELPFCVGVLNVQSLRKINEVHGHAAGDAVLRGLSELILAALRGEDVVARWGGDELVLGMLSMSREDGAHRLGDLLENLRQLEFTGHDGNPFRATFSAGVAEYPVDGADLHALYRAANQAAERARSEGGDRVARAGTQDLKVALLLGYDEEQAELSRALVSRGYLARPVSSARELLKAGAQAWILDVVEPQAMSALEKAGPDLGRVCVLALGPPAFDWDRVHRLGVREHLYRPFLWRDVAGRLRQALSAYSAGEPYTSPAEILEPASGR